MKWVVLEEYMITITIDGIEYEAKEGSTILEVARENNIPIPALCNHEALKPWGACRLCVVELEKPEWNGKSRITASCTLPVEKEMSIKTKSEGVKKVRKTVLNLLLARCPHSKILQQLGKAYGLTKTTLKADEGRDNCILCNLCTRICAQLGANAISTVKRGSEKEIGTPFGEKPPDCIGCLSCARNCPTDTIKFEESEENRIIWERTFEMAVCVKCGAKSKLTKEQIVFFAKKSGLPEEYFAKCDDCARKETAETFAQLVVNPAAHIMKSWGFLFDKMEAKSITTIPVVPQVFERS
jgi:bidirectional [NiFe] hydrogenase diaphorase subunit